MPALLPYSVPVSTSSKTWLVTLHGTLICITGAGVHQLVLGMIVQFTTRGSNSWLFKGGVLAQQVMQRIAIPGTDQCILVLISRRVEASFASELLHAPASSCSHQVYHHRWHRKRTQVRIQALSWAWGLSGRQLICVLLLPPFSDQQLERLVSNLHLIC